MVTAFSDASAASELTDSVFAPSFVAELSARVSIHTPDLSCTSLT